MRILQYSSLCVFLASLISCGGSTVSVPDGDAAAGEASVDDSACSVGMERCACHGNGTCNVGLTCASQRCVRSTGPDGGTALEDAAASETDSAVADVGRLVGPPYGHPGPDTTNAPKYLGFTLWLAEEFDAPLDLDRDPIWTWSDGAMLEGKARFDKHAISFRDGKMRINVHRKESLPDVKPQACSYAEAHSIGNRDFPLLSGEVRSRYNMFRYGRYEMSMKAPSPVADNVSVEGNYYAAMAVFRTPMCENLRLIEVASTGDPLAGAVHTNVAYANQSCRWPLPNSDAKSFTSLSTVESRSAFHTYAFEWLPSGIKWFVDGQLVREHASPDSGVKTPELSAKILLNLWIFNGSALGGDPANNTYPMTSEIEWVRFYKWDQETSYPCDGMGIGCLKADDMVLSKNNPCDGIEQTGTVTGTSPCTEATCQY